MLRVMLAAVVAWVLWASGGVAAEPPPLEAYGALPVMREVVLSPSGERYAMVAKVDGRPRVVVANAQHKALYVLDVGENKIRRLEWAGDDHVVVIASATQRLGVEFGSRQHELAGAFVITVSKRSAMAVFDRTQTRVANTIAGYYGAAQIGGRWFGYFAGYTQVSGGFKADSRGRLYADLYKVDLESGQLEMAAVSQPGVQQWLIAPTGEIAARLLYSHGNGRWSVRAARSSGVLLGEGVAPLGDISLVSFGRTADSVLIGTGEAGRNTMRDVSLADGRTLATFDADAEGVPVSDTQTRLWIGVKNLGGERGRKLFEPMDQARAAAAVKAFPGFVTQVVSCSRACERIVVHTEGGDDSGTYWMVEFDKGKGAAKSIGQSHPRIGADVVGPVRMVRYKAADGLPMDGVLTLPPGPARRGLPLVVMPHGGPAAHDAPGFDYWAQAFASRGYAVFQPNFRGSTGSGKAFQEAGYGQWGSKMQSDVSDGVAELAKQGLIDPQRVCIVGASYGGYAALAGVTLQQGLYRCAVSYGGVSDPGSMRNYIRERTGQVSAAVRQWNVYMPAGEGADIDDISPVRLASKAGAPVLLIHGRDDTVVPISQSQRMERALRSAGRSVELVSLPGADHWLLQEDSRIAMLKASVAFVLKHNPPEEISASP